MIGLGSRAQSQSTDFAKIYGLYVPWSKVLQVITAPTADFKDARNLQISEVVRWPVLIRQVQGLPVQISNVELTIKGQVNLYNQGLGRVKFAFEPNTLRLSAGEVAIKGEIVRPVGTATVKVRVDARCSQLQAKLDSLLSLSGNLVVMPTSKIFSSDQVLNPRPEGLALEVTMQNFAMQTHPQNLRLSLGTCGGLQGLDAVVESEIKKMIADPQNIIPEVRAKIEDNLQAALYKYQVRAMEVTKRLLTGQGFPDLSHLQVLPEPKGGFWFVGWGHAQAANPEGVAAQMQALPTSRLKIFATEIRHINPEFELHSPEQMQLSIDKTQFEKSLLSTFVKEHFKSQYVLNHVPELKKLLQSRFLQFFVFPDLLSFAKNTNFIFRSRSEQITAQAVITNNDKTSPNELAIKASLLGSIFADSEKKSSSNTEFMNVSLQTAGLLSWKVSSGRLVWDWRAKESDAKISYSDRVPNDHARYRRFPEQTLRKGVEAVLKRKKGDLNLPTISFGSGHSAIPVTDVLRKSDVYEILF